MQAFEHSSLYWAYLNGVPLGKALNKNELHVHKAKESKNQLLLTVVVTNYAPSCSYAWRTLHLEGEEVFKSHKRGTNLPLESKGDLHKHHHVNFSHPQMDTMFGIIIGARDCGHLPNTKTHCVIIIGMHNWWRWNVWK